MPTGARPDAAPAARTRRLRDLTSRQRLLLAGLAVLGLLLRLVFHQGRPFDGDEIGSLLYLRSSYGFLVTHFIEPWMSMSYYLVLLKGIAESIGPAPLVLRLPTLIADVCGIALVAALALRVSTPATALTAAALYALNPYLIDYAGVLRSYSVLTAFVMATLIAALDWKQAPSLRRGVAFAGLALLAILAHPSAVWVVLFASLVMASRWLPMLRGSPHVVRREAGTVLLPGMAAAALAAVAYLPTARGLLGYAAKYSHTPPMPPDYLARVFGDYFGSGWFVLPSLVTLALGLGVAVRRNTPLLVLAGLAPFLVLVASFQGLSHWPWTMSRYLIPTLPVLMIVLAEGIHRACRSPRVAWLAVVLLAASWLPNARSDYAKRIRDPIDALNLHLEAALGSDDVLLALDSRSQHGLRYSFQGRTQRPLQYAARLTDDPGRRLLLVSAGAPIPTSAPHSRFGRFQVTAYSEPTRLDRLRHVYGDLLRAGGGRARADLVEYYMALLDLQPLIEPGADRAGLMRLYYESFRRTPHGRHPLPQELDAPYQPRGTG